MINILIYQSGKSRPGAPRRLPHAPLPENGEAFDSWVERTAAALELSQGHAALALGLPVRSGSQPVRPLLFGTIATGQTIAALSASTGLTESEIRAMHLERFSGTAVDLARLESLDERAVRAVVEQEWALLHASRACGRCLAETAGAWPLWWRLGIAAVCPRHEAALVEVCPGCAVALRRGSGQRVRGLTRRTPADPSRCTNAMSDGTVCGFGLTELPQETVPQQLVATQILVLEIANGGPAAIGGHPATGREFFQALRALAGLARSCGAPWLGRCAGVYPGAINAFAAECAQRVARPTGALKLHSMPTSPAAAAALLSVAAPLLLAENGEAALDAVEPWAPAAHSAAGRRMLRNMPLPGPLRARFAALVPIRHKIADLGARPLPPGAALTTSHIPHLVDHGDYLELVAPLLPGVSILYGRRMASLALARMAGAGTWRQAAADLGLDPAAGEQLCNRAVKKIDRPAEFWNGIGDLARRLAARGPVDYQARRAALANLHEVAQGVLASAQKEDTVITPQRRQLAAAWLWTELTCGDYRDAPALALGWPATSVASRRTSYGRFAARVSDPWKSALISDGTRLLIARGAL